MKKLCKIIVLVMICSIGIISIKAETLSYDLGEYRLKYYMGNTSTWIGPYNFGTSVTTTSYDYIEGVAVRLGTNSNFIGSKEYQVSIEIGALPTTNAINNNYLSPTSFACYGSTSLTSWNQDSSKVESCEYIGAQRVGQTSHLKYLYKIRMTEDIKGIQINIYFPANPLYGIDSFRVYKATKISYGEDVTGAIDEQTIIIQNEFNDLEQTIINNNETLIETIEDQNKICNTTMTIKTDNKLLNSSGTEESSNNWGISDFINVKDIEITETQQNGYAAYCFYTKDKTLINCKTLDQLGLGKLQNIPSNAKYVRISMDKRYDNRPKAKICTNANEVINDTLNQDHNYDTETIEDQVNEYEETQDSLNENLDLDTEGKLSIWWNGTVMNYIWTKVNQIINSWQLSNLYLSLMALGIIRLVLGR